ncbi:MAG: DUF4857 domain-containing protein [Staphylococcus sp.]|nr:DUF4857 domain-containing protein [Staphylococcus sp.]
MKKAYSILLVILSVIVLSWFLPWLYSIVFPTGVSDPFIAYSPISDKMIVSETGDGKNPYIYALDRDGRPERRKYTKEERDSLLPQIYFTQLMARESMPDTIDGYEISVAALKHNQWVFSAIPRDINKEMADVYLIMESMPARLDLEDPKEVFRFRDGGLEFLDIETNSVVEGRSKRFSEIFEKRGFKFPMKTFSANITSRKPYDEGYLMVDSEGSLYHMKMQAGRPYMVKVRKPDSINVAHVFIMENIDTRHLGLVTDENYNLYVLEREGYRLIPLPVGKFDPEKDKISVVKNLFNWVVKITNDEGSRWTALDSDDYSHLAEFSKKYGESAAGKVASYIFPYTLSFTDITDCYASPRFENLSIRAIYLNFVLALILFVVYRRRHGGRIGETAVVSAVTIVFGIYTFIPFILIKD